MKRTLCVFTFLCFALLGCENNITSGINQVEKNDFSQSEDLVVEGSNHPQDEDVITDSAISDALLNEPDDRPIDYIKLKHLIESGDIEVMLYNDGIVMEIVGKFTSIIVKDKTDVYRVLDQVALLLWPFVFSYDTDDIFHFTAGFDLNSDEGGIYRDIKLKSSYTDAYVLDSIFLTLGYITLTADEGGVVTGLYIEHGHYLDYITHDKIYMFFYSRYSSLDYYPTVSRPEAEEAAIALHNKYLIDKGMIEDNSYYISYEEYILASYNDYLVDKGMVEDDIDYVSYYKYRVDNCFCIDDIDYVADTNSELLFLQDLHKLENNDTIMNEEAAPGLVWSVKVTSHDAVTRDRITIEYLVCANGVYAGSIIAVKEWF